MAKHDGKQCERCIWPAVKGERYCAACRKVVLREMRDSGYLASSQLPKAIIKESRDRPSLNVLMLGGAAEMGDDGDDRGKEDA